MWIWPIWCFWQFSPLQFVAGLIWNISEWTKVPLPNWLAPKVFDIMMGKKGIKKNG